MPDNTISTAATKTAKKKGKTRTKLILLGGFLLALVVVVQTGLVGYGIAHLRAATFPGPVGLLDHFPATTTGVVLIDTHRLDPAALGHEEGAARTYLTRTRDEIKKITGIDLWFDIDKIAIAPSLTVARGRFSEARVTDRLKESKYVEAEYKGVKYMVRGGEDALAVRDGSFLLYGDEAAIRASIDASAANDTLDEQPQFSERLDAVGWEYPVLGTIQISSDKPSVREVLAGSSGPRAVTVGLDTKGGLVVKVLVETINPASAEELRKLLDEKKADAAVLGAIPGTDVGPLLSDVAKRARVSVPPGTSQVAIQVELTPEELDRVAKAGNALAEAFKQAYSNVRLFQLLVPKF
ncbi:hypothetical protein [Chondromyces crocatus]|uniref:Uncharacterized protein n=1 Tax=Chondromyces crocatus TaxID=52 RepID=A0A0K1EGI3_CHOCO|nr:hypothetical protein [Chondromyces crocatus]AKT39981.1 uncharacterized protein CMC5_041340 [Chondromyces crocatus]